MTNNCDLSHIIFFVLPGSKDRKIEALILPKIHYPVFRIFVDMDKNNRPVEENPEKKQEDVKEEPIIHDGSGGAFEGTERVSEEEDDKPSKPGPLPY
ncbi:hypothetical protein CTE07_50140 [Chitinophaga terrae (ex Kim and Jung 2007)]|nr:hypothetical protein CTE07_50140 [Chitinophaga terrae (ex Kim and Jung 2007)]